MSELLNVVWGALAAWFFVGLFLGIARRRGWGQTVRKDGPQTHLVKQGTPTMGGAPFVVALLFVWILNHLQTGVAEVKAQEIVLLLSIVLMGIIGLIDDYLIVRAKLTGAAERGGLMARYKIALQIVVGLAFGIASARLAHPTTMDWAFWFDLLFNTFVMVGAVNAFNFTDGVDGLCAGVTLIIILPLIGVSPVVAIMAGCIVGYLWYNWKPASIFMGDVGSHALGALAAGAYILYDHTWLLPIAAVVPVMEILSVALQVAYFRQTGGKRIFKMTPIHHHFELSGWQEGKVAGRFFAITAIFTALAWGLFGKSQ